MDLNKFEKTVKKDIQLDVLPQKQRKTIKTNLETVKYYIFQRFSFEFGALPCTGGLLRLVHG